MVAESNPARRRRRRFESADAAASPHAGGGGCNGDRHRDRHRHRLTAAAVVLAAVGLAALAAPPIAASAFAGGAPDLEAARHSAAAVEEGVSVRIAPTVSTTITIGAPLAVEVEIVNATAETLAAGTVQLTRSAEPIDDTAELDEWVGESGDDAASESPATSAPLAEAESRSVAPGSVSVIAFTLPPSALDALAGSPVVGLGAELLVGDTPVARGADVFAASTSAAASQLSVALVYPLTVPTGGTAVSGVFDAEQLTTWTGPFGLLTRQLDAVAGRSVAIAIDPRIIASIRALGSSAPPSASAWLERLRGVPNEIFPLAYADADIAVQAQVGLPGLLTPTAFGDLLDPADFTDLAEADTGDDNGVGATGSTPTEGATSAPTPTPEAVPSTESLLEWPYTRTDIAWPADDTVAAGNLGFFAASGLTTSILAAGNVEATAERTNAAATIDGSTAVVADARITAPLQQASEALTDTEWRSAAGRLEAELAIGAGEGTESGGEPTTVLATFARGEQVQADRVAATIDELAASAWSQPALLSDAIGAPPTARTLVDLPEAEPRRASVQRVLGTEADVAAFATVLDDPAVLTGPNRRDVLALLDVAWLDDTDGWNAAVAEWLATQRSTLGAVSIVPGSPITVVSSETGVPTTLLNALPYPVTVVVDVDPSNGRLIVEEQKTVTVEAESRSNVVVPVAAGVGNGEVVLTVSLTSPEGVPIGTPVDQSVNVQADWEGLGAAILGIVVVLVFGIGIWRNIRRRRRQRAADALAVGGDADDVDGATPDIAAEDRTDNAEVVAGVVADDGADDDSTASASADTAIDGEPGAAPRE